MKHEFQNNQPQSIPVNYLKEPSEKSTNKEAGIASFLNPPAFMLNFPEYRTEVARQIKILLKFSCGFVYKSASSGGLMLASAIRWILQKLDPIFRVIVAFLARGIDKTMYWFSLIMEDFFRLMDGFFMMDDELMSPVLVDVENGDHDHQGKNQPFGPGRFEAIGIRRKRILTYLGCQASSRAISEFRDNSPGKAGNTLLLLKNKRFKPLSKMKSPGIPSINKILKPFAFNKTIIKNKLPLKSKYFTLSPLHKFFALPFYDKLFGMLDPVFIKENAQNRFVFKQ